LERGFTPTVEKIQDESTEVPNVVGMIYEEAKDFLEADGLLVLRVFEKSDQPEGVVVRMKPEAGTLVVEATVIALYVSSGD
jgi:serine/threonine-protein kinase